LIAWFVVLILAFDMDTTSDAERLFCFHNFTSQLVKFGTISKYIFLYLQSETDNAEVCNCEDILAYFIIYQTSNIAAFFAHRAALFHQGVLLLLNALFTLFLHFPSWNPIIGVGEFLWSTFVANWHFDNLCRSHFQGQTTSALVGNVSIINDIQVTKALYRMIRIHYNMSLWGNELYYSKNI